MHINTSHCSDKQNVDTSQIKERHKTQNPSKVRSGMNINPSFLSFLDLETIFADTVMMGHTDGEWALHLIRMMPLQEEGTQETTEGRQRVKMRQ